MSTLAWLIIIAAIFIIVPLCWVIGRIWQEHNEDRAAAYEFRASAPEARTFRVALPCMEAGSYHRAAPRPVIRMGPLYPTDLPGPALREPLAHSAALGNGEQHRAGELVVPGSRRNGAAVETGTRPDAATTREVTPRPATTDLPAGERDHSLSRPRSPATTQQAGVSVSRTTPVVETGTRPEAASPTLPPPATLIVPGTTGAEVRPTAVVPGAASLPVPGASDGRTTQRQQEGSRAPAADETSIDMDGWLIELLTCPPARIATAATRSLRRYEQQSKRELAAYLTELAQVAS